jgi:outer membrane protein W
LQAGSALTGFNTTAGVFMGAAINGPTLFQNRTDSNNNLQIQNSYGVGLLNVDTLTVNNLLSNGDIETGATTGWSIKNSATAVAAVTSGTTAPFAGQYSLQVQASTTANSGAQFTYAFSPNTTYTLSFYAKIASGAQNTDFVFGRQDNGSDITCATGQSH